MFLREASNKLFVSLKTGRILTCGLVIRVDSTFDLDYAKEFLGIRIIGNGGLEKFSWVKNLGHVSQRGFLVALSYPWDFVDFENRIKQVKVCVSLNATKNSGVVSTIFKENKLS